LTIKTTSISVEGLILLLNLAPLSLVSLIWSRMSSCWRWSQTGGCGQASKSARVKMCFS